MNRVFSPALDVLWLALLKDPVQSLASPCAGVGKDLCSAHDLRERLPVREDNIVLITWFVNSGSRLPAGSQAGVLGGGEGH